MPWSPSDIVPLDVAGSLQNYNRLQGQRRQLETQNAFAQALPMLDKDPQNALATIGRTGDLDAYSKFSTIISQMDETKREKVARRAEAIGKIAQVVGTHKEPMLRRAHALSMLTDPVVAAAGITAADIDREWSDNDVQTALAMPQKLGDLITQARQAQTDKLATDKFTYEKGKDDREFKLRQGTAAESRRHNMAMEGKERGEKAPAGYRYKADGNLEIIPGGPADTTGRTSTATDTQRVTALYADRAMESDRILTGSGKKGGKDYVEGTEDALASFWESRQAKAPLIGNYTVSEKYQKADQAKRDFINAVLRKESGAVIGKDEFDNAEKQYFPQPGDSESVKAQKRANRKTAINGLRRAAGSAINEKPQDTAPSDGWGSVTVSN